MTELAKLVDGPEGIVILERLVEAYQEWVEARVKDAAGLAGEFTRPAERNLSACRAVINRMRTGIDLLRQSDRARRAFAFMNRAMFLHQVRSRRTSRVARYDRGRKSLAFSEPYAPVNEAVRPGNKGVWRAFQMAFILMSLESAVNGESPDRETVDLIWFPTGGGKTEAYLGLASFVMFYRRLVDPSDAGVSVLMRYTLRLLTTQQFQRASTLITAMEYVRRQCATELGCIPYRMGVWLGGTATPNTRENAINALSDLRRGRGNRFLIRQCPWCGASMGTVSLGRSERQIIGIHQVGTTVAFYCPDTNCEFSRQLPVYVIDEDIYEQRPDFVVGTVDKFAMLAWKPEARTLFGIGPAGSRLCSPPGLIIQDELHLISGPLGSMVGHYETMVERFSTKDGSPKNIAPKIVCSTATIRQHVAQIRALYGRESVTLFPPPGLSVEDSFFSRYVREPSGELSPGKLFVGVHAPGLGSMQSTQVRTIASLLQGAMRVGADVQDPWWTLVIFHNSLRELGTTLTLFQSDIRDYLRVLERRLSIPAPLLRRPDRVLELTSRLDDREIPDIIRQIEQPVGGGQSIDAVLASNIIEVGIDIDRLSTMVVVGQPKSTAQYIQVTGRVGRSWWERPGLVVTLYSMAKPRDRSHFERFRSYHERLYAQVEPGSVTPFAMPVNKRALHAQLVSYVRIMGSQRETQYPYPPHEKLLSEAVEVITRRACKVDPDEASNTRIVAQNRIDEIRRWQRSEWGAYSYQSDRPRPLMRASGAYWPPEEEVHVWPVPTSLRNVDASCALEVLADYGPEAEPEGN